MSSNKKTDNRNLELKVAVRKLTIERAGFDRLRVLDLCAGVGKIWARMRTHYPVDAYTPCDRAPRMPGVIRGEAERLVEAFDLRRFNVIDIDTYGEPWECWLKVAETLTEPVAVFLTCGATSIGGCNISHVARSVLGIPLDWDIPKKKQLAVLAADYVSRPGRNTAR
jgi:hypothetical protein